MAAAEPGEKKPEWREFQLAVASFLAALAPNARVTEDAHLPDADTGRPRQRDVWIEAKVFGHFPIKILVSCKRWKQQLDESDIDAFIGELRSSGAQLGIVYSYSGFTEPAIEKARKVGISCCRLYANEPPDIPTALQFRSYCCTARVAVSLAAPPDPAWDLKTWNDLFSLAKDGTDSLLDRIVTCFREGETEAANKVKTEGPFPKSWASELRVTHPQTEVAPLRVIVAGAWKLYEGRVEAHLIDGSYSFNTGDFKGRQAAPWIDRVGPHPGPGWTLLDEPPKQIPLPRMVAILYHGDARQALLEHMGPRPLK
jgi:hypothetical protein